MRRLVGLIILVGFIATSVVAQRGGYLNKKFQASFEGYGAWRSGEIGLELKYSMKENFGFVASYKVIKRGVTYMVDDMFLSGFLNQTAYQDECQGGRYLVNSGSIFGIGYVRSKNSAGMPLPLGFYKGMVFERYSLEFTERVREESGSSWWNKSFEEKEYTYQHIGKRIKFLWGRTSIITGNIVLDYGLEGGVKFGKIISADTTRQACGTFPYHYNPFEYERSTYNDLYIKKYVGVYFSPRIRIGYLF